MSVRDFENKRWQESPQKIEFRHRACLDLVTDGTVLDIGCGDGLLLSLLREKGIESTGVDISIKAVEHCRAIGFTTIEHSLDNPLPFADNSFDTVVLLDVLEHVYEPLSVLLEARRIARTRVIVGVPNFSSLPARAQTLLGKVPENNRSNKGHIYWFNWFVLRSLVAHGNLRILKTRTNVLWESKPILGSLMRALAVALPNFFALSFVTQCEK